MLFFFPEVSCNKREESLLNIFTSFFHFRYFPTIPHSLLIKCVDKSSRPKLSSESKQAMKTKKIAKLKSY